MPREASSREQMTSSFTALAFAPGVLNTGMPSSVMRSTGMLFTPAPQRAMQRTVGGTSDSCSLWERSMMAISPPSRSALLPDTLYFPASKRCRPTGEIALKVLMLKEGPEYPAPFVEAGAAGTGSSFLFLASSSSFSRVWISSSTAARTLTTRCRRGLTRGREANSCLAGRDTPARADMALGRVARTVMTILPGLSYGLN
mmetsp:Transcript_10020/g.18057  ORF Transcript_10020/g.18057 Transcript_10020/m.18057 type:complete len:200 (-) Transcript_10020:101-700(-)